MPESTKQFEVRYTERNSRGWKENKSEWFDVVTDAFDFAKAHRPALVYTKEGSFIGNFTFKPTTGYSGPASKPNI